MAGKPKKNRTTIPVGIYLPPDLFQAFDAYVIKSRPKTSKTGIIQALLEEFLREKGVWPPPPPPPPEPKPRKKGGRS